MRQGNGELQFPVHGSPHFTAPGEGLVLLLTHHRGLSLFAGLEYVPPDHSNICFGGFSLLLLLCPSTSMSLCCGVLRQGKLLALL